MLANKPFGYWALWGAIWGALLLCIAACGTTQQISTFGHCEIPTEYEMVAQKPADLDPMALTQDNILTQLSQDDALQRGERAKLADNFNGFHDYVKDKCNGH